MSDKLFWKNPGYRSTKPLYGNETAQYLIVGGGISGLMSAFFLIQYGVKPRDIILVEGETIGSGSTGRSAGMLVPEPENEDNVWWDGFIKKYGVKLTKIYRQKHLEALRMVERIIADGAIRCEAERQDFIILARGRGAQRRVESDMRARRRLGEHPAHLYGASLKREFPASRFSFAERTHRGLSVNPLALSQGIASYLRRMGVVVYEHTLLRTVHKNKALFSGGEIQFKNIIYARGVAETGRGRMHSYVTSVVVTKKLPRLVIKKLKLYHHEMFIDDQGEHSFHYGKITADGRLLLGYGDERTREKNAVVPVNKNHIHAIRRFLKRTFPGTPLPVEYTWSGVYALVRGLLPMVRVSDHVALVNGAGIQLGSIVAAQYAVTQLLKKKHPLEKLWNY